MKVFSVCFTVAILIAISSSVALAAIDGTAHDLATYDATAPTGEICVFCHTPHNAIDNVPLWNRTNPTADFALYGENEATRSATLDGAVSGALSGTVTLMCLSCHDGTTAIENYGGASGGTTMVAGAAAIASDGDSLENDHPVNIIYDSTNDTELVPLATIQSGGVIDLFGADADTLQCGSCHDVHGKESSPGVNIPKFLRVDNTGSALCLTCHTK